MPWLKKSLRNTVEISMIPSISTSTTIVTDVPAKWGKTTQLIGSIHTSQRKGMNNQRQGTYPATELMHLLIDWK